MCRSAMKSVRRAGHHRARSGSSSRDSPAQSTGQAVETTEGTEGVSQKSRNTAWPSDDREVLGARGKVRRTGALAVELDLQAQVVGRVGVADRVLEADLVAFEQVEQRLVEGLHAEVAALLHDLL